MSVLCYMSKCYQLVCVIEFCVKSMSVSTSKKETFKIYWLFLTCSSNLFVLLVLYIHRAAVTLKKLKKQCLFFLVILFKNQISKNKNEGTGLNIKQVFL